MRIIIGDVETSGLGEDAGVVEVAWVETDDQLNVKSSAYSLIDPGVPISPSASGVHGITAADVMGMPSMVEFMGDALAEGDVLLVAHNVAFDERFFGPHIGNLVGTLCTLKMARLLYPDAENHKLQTLRYTLGIDGGEAHSASGDVAVLHELLKRMLDDSSMTLAQFYELSQRPVLIENMPFGKHKGLPLRDLPSGYRKWLLALDNLDDNLRYSLELL